jgi:hypothetical protein
MKSTYNGQGGGKPTIIGQRGLLKRIKNLLKIETKLAQRYWGVTLPRCRQYVLVYNDERKINKREEENMNLQKER